MNIVIHLFWVNFVHKPDALQNYLKFSAKVHFSNDPELSQSQISMSA